MKTTFLIALCSVLALCVEVHADGEQEVHADGEQEVHADGEQEVKRGLYPYMAILYYPDESVVDGTGSRFLRGAILIRPDWLVTSAVGPSIAPNGFPRKTLLARLGAITIDTNFTLNEDEDEQEREVIQIVRPYNHSSTQWWRTDISLMKVLSAFNITLAVGIANLVPKRELADKTCIILVFAKKDGNNTEDRSLIKISVEMQIPSIRNCGSHFMGNTMTCASDSDKNKNAAYDSNFCQGNSGGPLICENEVAGIQTYIDNDCKQPHLYQLLPAWENFVTCGTEDKCQEEQCSNMCDVINKDTLVTSTKATSEKAEASSENEKVMLMQAESSSEHQVTSAIHETTIVDDSEIVSAPATTVVLEEIMSSEIQASVNDPSPSQAVSEGETAESKSWPNEKYSDDRKKLEQGEIENTDRKPSVEAQHHIVKVRSAAGPSNMSNTLSLFFGFFILACLV